MTIKDHIMTLPDGYRELALKYEDRHLINWNDKCDLMYIAIRLFTLWLETDEGNYFWDAVADHYRIGTPLPPLPKQLP